MITTKSCDHAPFSWGFEPKVWNAALVGDFRGGLCFRLLGILTGGKNILRSKSVLAMILSKRALRDFSRQMPSKLNTRVRFPSPAPSPRNFTKQAPLLIEIVGGIRIFAGNCVQHFVQQNVQHDRALARFFDETKRHLALRTSGPDGVRASRSPWCCEAFDQDSDRV